MCVFVYTSTGVGKLEGERNVISSKSSSSPLGVKPWCEDAPDFSITEGALLLLVIILKHDLVRTEVMAKGHKPTCSSTCFSTHLLSSATPASLSSDKN